MSIYDEWNEPSPSTDYEGRCGNCHAILEEGAAYCQCCGTKRGEGSYAPYLDLMQCIYGPPPVDYLFSCPGCGHTFMESFMLFEERYCIRCGKKMDCQPADPIAVPYWDDESFDF